MWEMAEKEYITIAAVVLILVCVEVSVGELEIIEGEPESVGLNPCLCGS